MSRHLSEQPASSATAPRAALVRSLALPAEHGGWSFLFEPIALGLAVGHSARLGAPRDVSEHTMSGSAGTPKRVSHLRWTMALLLGGMLVFSVPFRARQELGTVDLTGVSYGLFAWGVGPEDMGREG